MNIKKGILITSGLYAIAATASLTLPRLIIYKSNMYGYQDPMGGLGAMLAALTWFVMPGMIAVIIALVALVMVIVGWKRLTQPIRMAGLAPTVITMIVAIVIVVLMGQNSHPERTSPRMEPKTWPAPTSHEAQTPQRKAENE